MFQDAFGKNGTPWRRSRSFFCNPLCTMPSNGGKLKTTMDRKGKEGTP